MQVAPLPAAGSRITPLLVFNAVLIQSHTLFRKTLNRTVQKVAFTLMVLHLLQSPTEFHARLTLCI
jgi:hypothetical protein